MLIAAWIEVLTLSKYFYGDTVSAGNQDRMNIFYNL